MKQTLYKNTLNIHNKNHSINKFLLTTAVLTVLAIAPFQQIQKLPWPLPQPSQ